MPRGAITKILLVEDSGDDAEFLRQCLLRSDSRSIEIARAGLLSDAVIALRQGSFDVVLLDLHLPDGNGSDCVEQIQRADPQIPVVVLSGQGDEDYAVEILNRGVQDYLVKWEGDGRVILRAIRYAIERKRSEAKLNYLARYDSLTGIPNRQYLREQLEHATGRAIRHRQQMGLLFLDLDRFKVVNDTLGHQFGDELLRDVVQRLKGSIREGDLLARLGGDEFAVLVEDVAGPVELEAMARSLIARFQEPFELGGRQVSVTASVGVTLYPVDNPDPMALLNNADIAMYQAKEQGRNNFKFFTPSMHEEILRYHGIENDLKNGLAAQQFRLVYQPQFSLLDYRVHAVEALLRWQHPVRGLIRPDEFISVAEETGHIVPLGLWVLDEACRQLKQWESAGLPVPRMAINVAAAHFHQPGFQEQVRTILDRHAVDPGRIELELTERSLMEDTDGARNCLRSLKNIGVRLSIDDFGTGYSCLAYLRRFPIDVLKIDRSFVSDLNVNRDDQAICGAILSIAQRLSLDSVAEGIETEQQLTFLAKHGCQFGQGYYFSAPVESAEIGGMLAQRGVRPAVSRHDESRPMTALSGL
ncbi:MAG TPA: EAL domain-containing protein [Gammaproteobacteria bacterium]|jgi:diguanylate cyclase (GGDEF)-like protein|nr:EAL domain-containing protein [Gammaproteobacteria bacterium]